MSAQTALKLAHEHGVRLGVDGSDLILEAAREPPSEVMDTLRRHKAEIVALLTEPESGWSANDWRVFFEERAAIAEFEGGLSRIDAEAQAFECCIVEWLNRYPELSEVGSCAWCRGPDDDGHVVVPFGTEAQGHTWLHSGCWSPWSHARRQSALKALDEFGLKPTNALSRHPDQRRHEQNGDCDV